MMRKLKFKKDRFPGVFTMDLKKKAWDGTKDVYTTQDYELF